MGPALVASLRQLGCAVTERYRHKLRPGERFSRHDCDVVFAHGPHNGSVLEAAATVDFGTTDRPLFVWWLLENLPASSTSPWLLRWLAAGRLAADRMVRAWTGTPIAATTGRARHLFEAGHRVRNWGEARHLHVTRRIDGFYVDSAVATEILARDGVPAVHLPFGGHETFGRDLGLVRDIDVIFLGQPGSRRRLHYLNQTVARLARLGIAVQIVDGRHGYLDGDARIRLLNRCKVVLNIMKEPEDSVGLRFLMAAANKALVVSEPSRALTLLKAGDHYVEVDVDGLADAAAEYVRNDTARTAIVDRAYDHLRGPGYLNHMVGRVLDDCRGLIEARRT